MCNFPLGSDPDQYEPRQRSVRIHGVITSIRLENVMWDVLSDIAAAQKCTTNALIARLYDDAVAHRSDLPNFSSFLRVTCVRHLMGLGIRRSDNHGPRLGPAEERRGVDTRHPALAC